MTDRVLGERNGEVRMIDRRFSAREITDALAEARAECYREPETDLWRSFWDRLTEGQVIPLDPIGDQRVVTKPVCVRDLKEGDRLSFGFGYRTVSYCVPSKIDPVYLIGFKNYGPQIAKGPDDEVQILND